ncbi:hypothetical protein HMPREF9103_00115 [Lentilactobacillus parafarraginis F0439]|uniref:Uncharacterized protein n=1 Tax=Lentilactobacillus parafarraginis F0439 TaxID=797515 RepID=G9ZK67_9LACO|nr:hypothetical protein [Lentilactobacillus parafarraginis]EHM01490.1 hypothetical protein HMPREF9103_00115 [Lentilactobacillus parafarraginis F0439]
MFAILTKTFNYLQSTGVLAAGIAFILAVWKAVLPIAQAHVKTAQEKSLLTAIEGLVARYAQVAALSKQDRFAAVLNDTLDFASDHGYTWAKSSLIKGLIESIYQDYKNAGKDVAPVITTPSSDVVKDEPEPVIPSTTDNSTADTSKPNSTDPVESDGASDIAKLEGEVDK